MEKIDKPIQKPNERSRKTLLIALVVVPCLLAVVAAMVSVQREIMAGHKLRKKHYGDAYAAIQSASQDIKLHPANGARYYQRAWYYVCDESYDEAAEDLNQASRCSNADPHLKAQIEDLRKKILVLKRGNQK